MDFDQSDRVATKVLRRALVSKMTRALQDRLALASAKVQHGLQDRSIGSVEPELAKEMKRKRSNSAADNFSDSSSISGRYSSTDLPASSPLTGPIFSDDITRSGSSRGSARKFKMLPPVERSIATATFIRPAKLLNSSNKSARKAIYHLPLSSPASRGRRSRQVPEMHDVPFQSDSITLDSQSESEEDDRDLPTSSYRGSSNHPRSSPPCTPPPSTSRRLPKLESHDRDNQGGKEGADLLLYLAASPSPAMRLTKSQMFAPSTPPSKNTPLPSSMMSTPGGQYLSGFAPTTPSTAFNFADYVNITPSPAQGAWPRTPSKTPLLAIEARRRLTFDSPTLCHEGSNTSTVRRGSTNKVAGLGMELGGALVP